MLKVEQGKDLGYVNSNPVLIIQHQVDAATIRAMLAAYVKAKSKEALLDLVEEAVGPVELAGSPGQGYYCSVDGAGAPSERHIKFSFAEKEAERLATKLPNKTVRIFRQVGVRRYEHKAVITANMVRS